MALLSIPVALSIAFSVGDQIIDEYFPNRSGNHVSYSCEKELDLRRPGMAMESMPFLEQGDTNLCAPYTASELIDAWRTVRAKRSLAPRERTSPMALGVEFAAKNDFPYSFPLQNSTDPMAREAGRWGGIVCVYVNSAREIGSCSDDALKEFQGKSPEAIAKTDALFHALKDYLALSPRDREEKRPRFAERILTILASLPPPLEKGDLPTLEQITEELTFFTGDDPYVPMSRLLLAGCRKHRTPLPELPKCRTKIDSGLDGFGWGFRHVPFREAETFKKLKELLARENPTPVAITYCHRVVRKGFDYRPTSLLSPECHSHWSLVIGSRQRSGRCQFLIRDTDGGKTDRISPDWETDRGDVWLDAETLMSSTYVLEWLE
ncbi:MAG: hypothetical protein JST04_03830 [Bdellovibrionales bacterium]|nr:hypothetical protein [Bdellovibrionales bacterium]